MRLSLVAILVAAVGIPGFGCNAPTGSSAPAPGAVQEPRPFLGFPEDRARKIEDENPGIDTRLHGITTMTAVEPADYATYLELKKEGKIVKEETRSGFVFFATEEIHHAPLPAAEGGASGAYIKVTNRHKAPLPKGS